MLKHYVDSLLVLRFEDLPSPLIDMGSGGGLPGIPLKIARGDVDMILAEPRGAPRNSSRKPAASLGLTGIEVVAQGRAGLSKKSQGDHHPRSGDNPGNVGTDRDVSGTKRQDVVYERT